MSQFKLDTRHHSSHEKATAKYKNAKTYELAVNKIAEEILDDAFSSKTYCNSPATLKKKIYDRSSFILKKLDSHSWALANQVTHQK